MHALHEQRITIRQAARLMGLNKSTIERYRSHGHVIPELRSGRIADPFLRCLRVELRKEELLPCCTKCGLVCLEYVKRRETDAESDGLTPELRRWLSIDSGISSKTIASVLVPELRSCVAEWGAGVPRDPADFGRCYRLLKLIPGGTERMGEVAARYPEWAPLVSNWSELTRMYEEELPTGSAPKMYRRMKELEGRYAAEAEREGAERG